MDDPDRVTSRIRVFLLDDHELVRRGLADLMSSTPDIEVVGEASTADEALRRITACTPDVAILDARLQGGNGIDVCREVRSRLPEVKCLILTSYDDDDALFAAVMAGASGYLLKEIRGNSLVDSIRRVAAGQTLIDPSMTAKLMQRLQQPAAVTQPSPIDQLTTREREILELIADGRTNRQIAETLFLAEKTVKNYVSSLLAKLGMERRTQAAVFADRLRPNP